MTNVPRISNLVVETTEERESVLWAAVLSHRNKILSDSDWTQLPDSGLTEDCVERFRNWRRLLKDIKRSSEETREDVEARINTLSRRQPFLDYAHVLPAGVGVLNLEAYRDTIFEFLDENFNRRLMNMPFDLNPVLVEEQYKEALDFLTGKVTDDSALVFLDSERIHTDLTREEVANNIINLKAQSMSDMAKLKRQYNSFKKLVFEATTDVELTSVRAEISKWTLTST